MLKAITLGDTDLTTTGADAASIGRDARIRVVLTDQVTELTGSVRNAQGDPVTEYVVVVMPAQDPAVQVVVRNSGRRFTLGEGQAVTLTLDLMP